MVAGVESRDGVLYTRFTRIDLNSRAEKASFELEGLAVKAFPDQDSAVIVMDDRCVLCSNDGTVSETVPFDGKTVLNIFSDPGKDIVIAFGDNRRNEINCFTVFTRKLSTAGTVDYRDQIDDVWMSGDRVFILTRDHISAYSHSGVLEEIYHCDFSTYSFVYFGGLIAFEPKYLVKLSRENREVVDKA